MWTSFWCRCLIFLWHYFQIVISVWPHSNVILTSIWWQVKVILMANWYQYCQRNIKHRHQNDLYIIHHFDFEIMTSSWCRHFMSKWHCQVTSFCHQNDFALLLGYSTVVSIYHSSSLISSSALELSCLKYLCTFTSFPAFSFPNLWI